MNSPPPEYVRSFIAIHCNVQVAWKLPLFQRLADQAHIAWIVFHEKYFEAGHSGVHCRSLMGIRPTYPYQLLQSLVQTRGMSYAPLLGVRLAVSEHPRAVDFQVEFAQTGFSYMYFCV